MKITIESTSEIIELITPSGRVPARLWEGKSESGIDVHVLVTRIAVRDDQNLAEFEAELKETRPPSPLRAFPLSMIL